MGRTLKRVPLDFDWPIDQLWKGYINPYRSQQCKSCDGSGLNPETKRLRDGWYSFDKAEWVWIDNNRRYNNLAWQYHLTEHEISALIEAGRLMDFTHTCNAVPGEGWKVKDPPYVPTPEEVNEWAKTGVGHDAINQWVCVQARSEKLGIYGQCKYCKGEGELWASDQIKQLNEDWEDFDPPTGDGFQLWNTTTEGHPMTPVFDSLDALCQYLVDNDISVFAGQTATKERWKEMLDDNRVYHQEGNNIFI